MELNVQQLLENFPTEMLVEIFTYLNEIDITESVIYVCKRWYSATKHLQCMNIRHLNFTTRPPPSNTLNHLRNTDFEIVSIDLNDPIFELFPVELWQELGKTTREIRFNRCTDLNEEHLLMVLKHFPNLESLNFRFRFPSLSYGFNAIESVPDAAGNLKNVRRLYLNSNIWMDMSKVEQLVSRMPQLQHFGLWCLGITPVNDIMKVIKRQPRSIKSLSLRHCRCNNWTTLMENLTKLNGLSLEKFTFSISWVAEQVVRDFFMAQDKIQVLQIGTTVAFPNNYFDYLLNLQQLKELSVDIVEYQHTHHILKRFLELPFLHNLSLERECEAEHTNCIGIHKVIQVKKLKHMRVTYFNLTCQLCIENFYESLCNLRSLSLPSSNITNNELSLIFEHMPKLRSLDLARCVKITDVGMIGQTNGDSNNRKRQKINKFGLNSLKGLTYLNLNGCTGLTDVTFLQPYEMLDLKTLNVGCIPGLTATGIENFSKCFKCIETLQIYGNPNLDARVLEMIFKNLRRLRELDISKYSSKDGCKSLTEEEIDAIVQFSTKLKTLVTLKRKLLDKQIVYLFQNISTLESVNDVTRTRLRSIGDLDRKIMRQVPMTGEVAVVEESFLKILEQVRDKNIDFIKEPIRLSSFLI